VRLTTARLADRYAEMLQTIDGWRPRRFQFTLERWEQVRTMGRGQFVWRQGLTLMVFMTAFNDVVAHIIYGADNVSSIWGYLGKYFFIGIFLGYMEWHDQESKYKQARLNASMPVFSMTTRIRPH